MEEAQLQRRFTELAERAYRTGRYTYTGFLNLMELDACARAANVLRHVPFSAWGGAEGCERKVARFGDASLCGQEEAFPIACVRIAPAHAKFADELTHRDFLGALMHIGIERDTLGDIRIIGQEGFLFCLARIAPYILETLTKVRHTTVACSLAEGLPRGAALRTEEVRVQVSSERLDAVIARLYNLPRTGGQALFQAGRVFVNDRLMENSSYAPREGDIVSVRGQGKFLYRGVAGLSKKGKCNVVVEKYV